MRRFFFSISDNFNIYKKKQHQVCYNISANWRRAKTARICESYGVRVQYSVFECPLDELRFQQLKADLETTINRNGD